MGVTQSAHERPLSRGTFGVAQVVKPRVVGGGSSVVSALSAPVDADADVPAPPDTGAAAAKAVTPAAPSVPVVHKLHAPGCDLVHGGGAERRDVRGAATAASPAPKGATRDPETPTADSQAASKLACSCDADPDRSATILIESKTAGKESSVEEQDVQRTAAVVAAGAVATVGGQVRAGRHPADVTIPDDSMRRQHLLCSARDRTTVHVRALAKTYHLIGQGRFSAGLHKLVLHQVVKMGACSVQVTELCLDDASPDVAPAAGEEAPCGSGGDVHVGAGDGEGDGAGAGAGAGAETAAADGAGCASDAAVAAAAGSAPAPPVPAKRVCYICWEDSTGEGTSELVASPCVCNNHVHRKCLLTWLESRAMRECPVCKTTLPCGAVVPPPYIVLRVVRHMRNHVWAGRKEFVIGFAGRESNAITIGSSDRCDVPLPDPSVSRSHARVSLRDGEFYVEDLSSSGGTYLRLMTSSTLSLTRPVTLKAGRSTLALRVAPVPASPTDDKAAVSRSASRAVTASTAPVGAAPPVPPAARTTPRHRVVYRSAQSGADVDGGEAHGSAEAEGVGPQATDVPPAGRASKTRFARLWALRKSSSK